ncbi:hypothetical protein [Turicibacter sp.]|uniref:hypothetical protein n=1 Tax=Turicibacter sp. TaxID=2049042 RepID=UPI001B7915F0|nr:hypothetical protein [Turicibacter sp.]MBP3903578.1 hypothetical protein [Turicibacter sp.]MBP3908080.1 hypothetical protein [Turicibacter sp.]
MKKKKIDDATRITLYFSKNESELLEFVEHNDEGVKRNTFIMSLIRQAFEDAGKDKVSQQRSDEYSKLLTEIRELKDEQIKQFEFERSQLLDEIKELKDLIKNIKVVATDSESPKTEEESPQTGASGEGEQVIDLGLSDYEMDDLENPEF